MKFIRPFKSNKLAENFKELFFYLKKLVFLIYLILL